MRPLLCLALLLFVLLPACECGGIAPDGGPLYDSGTLRDGGPLQDGGVAAEEDAGAQALPDAGEPPLTDGGDGADMVVVPAGPFVMGCDDCDADEAPEHNVTLSGYEIDRTEVTQAAYQACVDSGGCTLPSDNFDPTARAAYPVVNVTWQQADEYCVHVGKRLPTEAEWEKAARGTDGRTFPWGEDAAECSRAITNICGGDAFPVGSAPLGASPYGAADMAGNVWEWTADWYAEAAYVDHDGPDPGGPASGTSRVYRGGSAGNQAQLARTSNRASTYNPEVGGSGLGFRCAR